MRITTVVTGTLLLTAFLIQADEPSKPYKRMLDDPVTFTGTETLDEAEAEYRIGVFAPDGDDHPVGRDLVRGVTLALEQANRLGGVGGRPVRMVRRWADDPWGAGSKEVVEMVFDDRVWALIGGPDGGTTHVAQQVATKAHLPLIAPLSSDPSLTHTRVPWIFRLPPDDRTQADLLVTEALAKRGLESVGVLVSTDHDGRTFAREIMSAMERRRNPPIFEFTLDPSVDDPVTLAERIHDFAPDALVMRLEPDAIRRVFAALQSVGTDCAIFLPWVPGLDLAEFPPSYDGPVIQVEPFQKPMECGTHLKFMRAVVRRYGARTSWSMIYGYDAARLVIEALRRGAEGRVELQRRLSELSGYEGASGVIQWDNGGGNVGSPVLKAVR